ncbi:ComEC/Rec2 family competence protein [Paenibacillus radicis (ex Gao et al. 2016)]|uniref:Metallo-beta-lactamase domain-containing protein n=1 Tax=Paenibacillus radicis (ex Gao et al. 2016) TaxID=1737354 RepID=A0A917M6F3_9BACL|nr:MBL fold metallo-hydrolase [Paenibacillus radicis (ex Gao et al. 2016)]GGG81926.1 hypothetical protein GCM10010918_44070 [Paenibacillus radicis (ex Gao et al. 2016)]
MTCVIDFLNVGFGEATIIQYTYGDRSFCLVVDGGDVHATASANSRRCSLAQYIQEHHIEKIDVLVITHFHRDHIGGVYDILGHVPIGKIKIHLMLPEFILESGVLNDSTPMLASLSLYIQILNRAKELNIPIDRIEEPAAFYEQELTYKLLMPDRSKLEQLKLQLNDLDMSCLEEQLEPLNQIDRMLNSTAMAVLISYKGESIALITSDVALDFWEPYREEIENIAVVQAPHHGDRHQISGEWLSSINPQAVIVSADDEGTYQLPHKEIEAMIAEHSKAKLYYTEAAATTHRILRVDAEQCRVEFIQ